MLAWSCPAKTLEVRQNSLFIFLSISGGKPLLTLSFIPIGVIWPVIVDQLINKRRVSLGWTLRTIGFLQLFLMVIATLLVSPRFPQIPREPIPAKQFLTDKRTSLFTLSTLIFFFAIYIPYVRIESNPA